MNADNPMTRSFADISRDATQRLATQADELGTLSGNLSYWCPNDAGIKELVLDLRQIECQMGAAMAKAATLAHKMMTGELPNPKLSQPSPSLLQSLENARFAAAAVMEQDEADD